MTFVLKIELGNEAMQSGGDVAEALHKLAYTLHEVPELAPGFHSGRVRDRNGNPVGSWEVQ